MKKINFRILSLALFVISLSFVTKSCTDDFLTPKPLSMLSPDNVFGNVDSYLAALAACDKKIFEEYHYTIMVEYWFSDIAVCGITALSTPPFNFDIQVTPTTTTIMAYNPRVSPLWYWTWAYKLISYANLVISRIDQVEFDSEAERNAILGAAYFYRAYGYYRLTNQFGDVPFTGSEINSPRLDFKSTKRTVILEKIKKDMEFASEWCTDAIDRGRATKGACAHLLTKINLALGEFDDAINSANAVINGGNYSLMRSPFGEIPQEKGNYLRNIGVVRDDVIARLHWHKNKALQINKEVLYLGLSREDFAETRIRLRTMYNSIPHYGNTAGSMLYTPDLVGPGLSTSTQNEEIDLMETFGRGVGSVHLTSYYTQAIWDDPNDLRHKKYNWMEMEDLVYNSKQAKAKSAYYGRPVQKYNEEGRLLTSDTIRNWFAWPHYKLYVPSDLWLSQEGGPSDMYIYRLAETYLLRAEAYWWKGETLKAMSDVNEVRTRAGCEPYNDPGKFDLSTILDERSRELYYEEPRKTELTRIAFLFAETHKSFNNKTYSIENFGTDNFYYDWIIEKNSFYNKGQFGTKNVSGVEYRMSPYHVLWPVPQAAIDSNTKGRINQNFGYYGFENNIEPLTIIEPEDDI